MENNTRLVIGCLIMSHRAYEYMLERGLAVEMFELEYTDIVQQILDYRLENSTNLVPLTILSSRALSKVEISTFVDFQEHESATLFMAYWDAFQSQYLEAQAKALIHDAEFNQEGLIELSDNLISLTNHQEKYDMDTLAQETIADVIARNHRDYQNPYKTGLYDYDRLGHLEIGDLLILGGQSGHGKSRFALNLTYKWLDKGLPGVLSSCANITQTHSYFLAMRL